MILFILISIGLAKIKGYRIRGIGKCCDLYPLFLTEGVYTFFVLNAYVGNYRYVSYAKVMQIGFLLSMLVPLVVRKLYVEGIIGSVLVMTGTLMNQLVISANHQKMPVLPTLSRLTGYYREGTLSQQVDELHIMMTKDTNLNLLGDYIDTGFSIMSIGDVLIHSFIVIMVYAVIKSKNKMEKNT